MFKALPRQVTLSGTPTGKGKRGPRIAARRFPPLHDLLKGSQGRDRVA